MNVRWSHYRLCTLHSALCTFLALVLVSSLGTGSASWARSATQRPLPVGEPPTVGFFPVQAPVTEGAADVNLMEDALRAAMQEAVAQRPVVDVVLLDSEAAQIMELVAKGILSEGAVGRSVSVGDVGAIVRSLNLKAAVLPRLERAPARGAHPAFQFAFGVLLPQSGRLEDLALAGTVAPAALTTSRDFEAGVRQLSARLASDFLPALVGVLLEDKPRDPDAAAQAVQLAEEKMAAGDYEEGARLLQQAVLLAPGSVEYSMRLGDVFLRLNRPAAAADAYRGAVQASPTSFDARRKFADCLVQLSRFSEAEKQLQIARQLTPKDPSAVVALAGVYLRQRDYEKALKLLEGATREITDSTVYIQLGDVHRLLKHPESAESAYRRALELGAAPESCYSRLAQLFADQKDFARSFHFLAQQAQEWAGPRAFSNDEVRKYLQMVQAALVQILSDSREEIIKFTQVGQSRVRLFGRLSLLREEALDVSSFLAKVESPRPLVDLTSQWDAIAVLVGQIMLDHLIHVDTNDTSYNLVANELRVRANAEIDAAQKELAKTSRE